MLIFKLNMPYLSQFQPHFFGRILTYLSIVFLLTIQVFTVNARSVAEDTFHNDAHHKQHNQYLSNRNQNPPTAGGSEKLTQAATQFNGYSNRCQQGWIWFNNKCWVTTQSRRDFNHAVELCKKMYNSTLPTIHSIEENEFLRNNIELNKSPIWLYAKHNHQYNQTKWGDKSKVVFTNWEDGQPSDKMSLVCIKTEDSWYMKKTSPTEGGTECVSFWEDAKWGTQVGCQVLLPVVCERKLIPLVRGNETVPLSDTQMASMSGAGSFSHHQMSIFLALFLKLIIIIFISDV